MKEIKFRGKRITDGKWVYGYFAAHRMMATGEMDYFIIVDEQRPQSVDPETVGQFTGMMDKKRKDIYGGDIVEVKVKGGHSNYYVDTEQIIVVKYLDKSACWSPFNYCRMWADDDGYPTAVEVIGNIYDNTELIEKPSK